MNQCPFRRWPCLQRVVGVWPTPVMQPLTFFKPSSYCTQYLQAVHYLHGSNHSQSLNKASTNVLCKLAATLTFYCLEHVSVYTTSACESFNLSATTADGMEPNQQLRTFWRAKHYLGGVGLPHTGQTTVPPLVRQSAFLPQSWSQFWPKVSHHLDSAFHTFWVSQSIVWLARFLRHMLFFSSQWLVDETLGFNPSLFHR